jgi:hypothetical protein
VTAAAKIIAHIEVTTTWFETERPGAVYAAAMAVGAPVMRCPRRGVPLVPSLKVWGVIAHLKNVLHRDVEIDGGALW